MQAVVARDRGHSQWCVMSRAASPTQPFLACLCAPRACLQPLPHWTTAMCPGWKWWATSGRAWRA